MNARVKALVVGMARKFGFEITPIWNLDTAALSRRLRHLFSCHHIDCVLDVGANVGQYGELIRNEVGWQGTLVSFEPVAASLERLRERASRDPHWHVRDYGLGSEDGEAVMNIGSSSSLNSMLAPSKAVVPGFWRHEEMIGTDTIPIRSLDSVIGALKKEFGFSRPYLKIDTQGYDLEVLRGAVKTLADVPALQTEASVCPIYERQPDFIEVIEHLRRAGFTFSGAFPVFYDEAGRLIEFDCVMVNDRFARDITWHA